MRATKKGDTNYKIAVPLAELTEILGCGQVTARKIAADANARVKVGKRMLYNVEKIKSYVDNISV